MQCGQYMDGLGIQSPSRTAAAAAAAAVGLFHTISSGDVRRANRKRPLPASTLLNLRPRDLYWYGDRWDVALWHRTDGKRTGSRHGPAGPGPAWRAGID